MTRVWILLLLLISLILLLCLLLLRPLPRSLHSELTGSYDPGIAYPGIYIQ